MISNTVKNAFPMICLSRPRLPGASQSWRPPAGCPGPARGLGRAPNQRAGVAQATWTGGESDWTDDPSSGGRPGDPGLGIPRRRRSCRRKTISFRWRAPIRSARSRPGLPPSTQDRRSVPVRRGHEMGAYLTRRPGWRGTSGESLCLHWTVNDDRVWTWWNTIPANFPPALMH